MIINKHYRTENVHAKSSYKLSSTLYAVILKIIGGFLVIRKAN